MERKYIQANTISKMVLFRVRFFDDVKNDFITEWTLCKKGPFRTLVQFYSDIQCGDVECGFSHDYACTYDVDKLWAEYAGSDNPQPVTRGHGKEFCRVSSLDFTLGDLAEETSNRNKGFSYLFIIFHVKPYDSPSTQSVNPGTSSSSEGQSQTQSLNNDARSQTKNAFDVMRNACHELCVPDKKKGKNRNIGQYNKIIEFLETKSYKVQRSDIKDYEKFIELLATVLWDVDPHHKQFKSRCLHLLSDVTTFFGYNDPKNHKHKIHHMHITLNHNL